MLAQFKLLILSLFMAGNVAYADVSMDNIDNIKQVACLSQAVQGEAGNQSFAGKVAVAHVILNRTKDEKFPDTPCAVIKQPGQFDFKPKKLHPDSDPALKVQMEESVKAALAAVNGDVPDRTKGSTYFVNMKTATDISWLKRLRKMVRIDDHWFFASPKRNISDRKVRYAMNS